jgi:hypothetical protein
LASPESPPERVGAEEEEGVEELGAALPSTNGLLQTKRSSTAVRYVNLARQNGDGGRGISAVGGGGVRAMCLREKTSEGGKRKSERGVDARVRARRGSGS